MISSDQWINLPVGHNLNDHVGVSAVSGVFLAERQLT